jgi:putative hydrolase of the HAD superfamily
VSAPSPPEDAVAALLFDLGGVMIDIDFERMFDAWAPLSALSPEQLRQRFCVDTAYQRHERGELSSSAYFAHVRRLLELSADDLQISAGWNAIFAGVVQDVLQLVQQAGTVRPCFCFTNTNPVHRGAWSRAYPDVVAAFDQIFVSSDLGMRKPDVTAYRTVAGRIGVPPSAILFFDDLAENVAGARAAGMRAVQVRSPADVRQGLLDHGLLLG